MSWLTDLVNNKKAAQVGASSNSNVSKISLYISVDFTAIKFLKVDEGIKPKSILMWKEVATGPFEDIDAGLPVKDIYGVLTKILTSEKEILENVSDVSVSLSAEGIFFKTIETPKMEAADMQKAVLAVVRSTLPVDFSQVLFAQNDLGEKHENMKTFFCVMIQKAMFEGMKEVFAKFNLNPYFEIEVFSLARLPERDDNYRLIVQVSKTNAYLIFLHGQIIQEVVTLDMGDNKINTNIQKNLQLSYKDVSFLRARHEELHNEGRFGAKIMDEYVKDFNHDLGKSISLHIIDFEKRFVTEIKDLLIVGADASSKLQRAIHDEFDAEIKVEFLGEKFLDTFTAENFLETDIKRYAQCFGLAKRIK